MNKEQERNDNLDIREFHQSITNKLNEMIDEHNNLSSLDKFILLLTRFKEGEYISGDDEVTYFYIESEDAIYKKTNDHSESLSMTDMNELYKLSKRFSL